MKKRFTLIICSVLALLLLVSCGTTENTSSVLTGSAYQKISAADGRKLFESDSIFTLVDVRRADEYEDSHIPSAINIPNESIESTQPKELPDLNKTVVVYCRTGVRSKQAADKLVKMGYTDVRDMGGIVDWPYTTVSGTAPGKYSVIGRENNTVSPDLTNNDSNADTSEQSVSSEGNTGNSTASSNKTTSTSKPADSSSQTGSKGETVSKGIMGNFSAQNLDGKDIDQGIFAKYDLTMVNVWATYCGPCLSEMPDLGELAKEYESKGVRIVGMVSDVLNSNGTVNNSQLDTARTIVQKTGANYMHIIPSKDLNGVMSQVTAVPTTIFVDASGTQVGKSYVGSRSKAEWKKIIAQMLEEAQK